MRINCAAGTIMTKTLSQEQLDSTVTVYDGDAGPYAGPCGGDPVVELLGEFYPVTKMFCTTEVQTNVLDPNHPVLEITA